jgi:hypothetical protein
MKRYEIQKPAHSGWLVASMFAVCFATGCLYSPGDKAVIASHKQSVAFGLYAVYPGDTLTLLCSPMPFLGQAPQTGYRAFATATAVTNGVQFQGTTLYSATTQAVVPDACWSGSDEYFGWVLAGQVGSPPPSVNTYIMATERGAPVYTTDSRCVGAEVQQNKSAQTIGNDCQLKDAQGNRRGNILRAD